MLGTDGPTSTVRAALEDVVRHRRLESIADWSTDEATELIERAEEAMDRLLVATMKGHVEAGRPAGRQARPSAPCGA